jgi:uncharacterized membrane protein YczE
MNETKKVIVFREPLLLFAMMLVDAGVTLMIRSGFGISVASSVPYVFSLHFTQLSFGTWTFISYVFVILLLIVLIKHFEVKYIISFGISFIVGILNDLFKYLWSFLPERTILFVLYYFLGWFCLSLGIACFVKSELPPAPYELFIRDIARFKKIPIARAKTLFDLGSLLTSLLFLIFVVKRLTGIGIGTVIAGLFNGTVVGFWIKLMNRHFNMRSLLPTRKPDEKTT